MYARGRFIVNTSDILKESSTQSPRPFLCYQATDSFWWILFYTIPPDELFFGIIELRPIKALSTATALRRVFVLDDFLAPRANGEAVLILVDSDCSYSSRQTVCRGEQQVKDGVGKRTLLRNVLLNVPVIVGILMTDAFENLIHFIITSAVQRRWLRQIFGCIYVQFCLLYLENATE